MKQEKAKSVKRNRLNLFTKTSFFRIVKNQATTDERTKLYSSGFSVSAVLDTSSQVFRLVVLT